MKLYNKIFGFFAPVAALIGVLLSFLQYGGIHWYDNIYAAILGTGAKTYSAHIYENSIAGTIFLVLSLAVLVASVVAIILRFAKKKEIFVLNIAISGAAILAAIFGVFAVIYAHENILMYVDGKAAPATGLVGLSFYTENGTLWLNTITYLSYVVIGAAAVSVVFQIIGLVKKAK